MVIMENSYLLQEMWEKINKYHLSYLEMEESSEKINQRLKLEDVIKDFLCMASHNQKFVSEVTADVLEMSANKKKDFSAYKAANGWNTIQIYAGNLLSQPWRKEYRQIKTYSGVYKHQIQANLEGADLIFETMGYKHDGNGVLILEGPICPDTVTNVSRDCLVAYVECQILKKIWEGVTATGLKTSWQDVLNVRKSHLCSPEECIRSLSHRLQASHYNQDHQRSYSQGSGQDYLAAAAMPQRELFVSTTPMQHPMNQSFPPLSNHQTMHHHPMPPPLMSTQPSYGYGCYPSPGYTTYGTPHVMVPPTQYGYTMPNMNPMYMNGSYATIPNGYPIPNYFQVPTGQLIDVDNQNGGGYDVVDKPTHSKYRHTIIQETPIEMPKNKPREEIKPSNNRDSDKDDSQFENWDYVYRNLESKGYSKDVGERGDLLSPNNDKRIPSRDYKKVKTSNLDELLNNVTLNDRQDRPLNVTEPIDKYDRERKLQATLDVKQERRSSQGSSYENVTYEPAKKASQMKPTSNVVSKTKTLPKEKNITKELLPNKTFPSKTLDLKKIKEDKKNKEKEAQPLGGDKKWQCRACTFLNENCKDICEMCSKTRKNSESEPTMEIGGSECEKCTLVNKKDVKICVACGASLKDSATYI